MICDIVVFSVDTETYDDATDTWSQTTTTYLTDKARVQPVRSSLNNNDPSNETTIQTVLVSVPISNNTVDLKRGLQMSVLVSPLNPQLLRYTFVVDSLVDSSNPLERTFYCAVNEEDLS